MKTAEEIRKKICSIFDENSSDANNGQMSVITEDSYSDTIDEVVELFEAYYKEKQIELPSDAEVKHPIGVNCKEDKKRNYCYHCGTTVKNQKYCHGCGYKLKWDKIKQQMR